MGKRFVSVGECMIEMSGGEGGQYRQGFAGDTLNTAWYAKARLPNDWTVDYATALGDDLYSGQMREFLSKAGIGTGHIQEIAGKRPGLYLIHQQDGDRHFTYWRDQSAARMMTEDRDALENAFVGANLVYFSGITMAILNPRARGRLMMAIVKARDAGAKVAFDPNIRPALWSGRKAIRSCISAAAAIVDIVLPTHADEKPFFDDLSPEATAERYLEMGVSEVVVKNGADPALIVTANERVVVPAQKTEVVDATGAGDSFGGAYLAARLMGMSLEDSAKLGHATAARVVGHKGALIDPAQLD